MTSFQSSMGGSIRQKGLEESSYFALAIQRLPAIMANSPTKAFTIIAVANLALCFFIKLAADGLEKLIVGEGDKSSLKYKTLRFLSISVPVFGLNCVLLNFAKIQLNAVVVGSIALSSLFAPILKEFLSWNVEKVAREAKEAADKAREANKAAEKAAKEAKEAAEKAAKEANEAAEKAAKEANEAAKELDKAKGEKGTIEDELTQSWEKLRGLETENKKLNQDLVETRNALSQKTSALEEEKREAERTKRLLSEKTTKLTEYQEHVQQDIRKVKAENAAISSQFNDLKSAIDERDVLITGLKKELAEKNAELLSKDQRGPGKHKDADFSSTGSSSQPELPARDEDEKPPTDVSQAGTSSSAGRSQRTFGSKEGPVASRGRGIATRDLNPTSRNPSKEVPRPPVGRLNKPQVGEDDTGGVEMKPVRSASSKNAFDPLDDEMKMGKTEDTSSAAGNPSSATEDTSSAAFDPSDKKTLGSHRARRSNSIESANVSSSRHGKKLSQGSFDKKEEKTE